jgi:hypothetical protein
MFFSAIVLDGESFWLLAINLIVCSNVEKALEEITLLPLW